MWKSELSCEAAVCQVQRVPTVTLPGLALVGEVISAATGEKNNMMCNFPGRDLIESKIFQGQFSALFIPGCIFLTIYQFLMRLLIIEVIIKFAIGITLAWPVVLLNFVRAASDSERFFY